MKVIPLRLTPGQDLRLTLEAWMGEQDEQAGCVISGIGSLSVAQLRLAGATEATVICGELEIISLSGTLSPDGAHLHIAVADSSGTVIGGHLCAGWCAPPPSWWSACCPSGGSTGSRIPQLATPSWRSGCSQSGDRPQRLQQIRQSLLACLIRRQERRQCLVESGGVQQVVELRRQIVPQFRRAEPAFLQQRGTAVDNRNQVLQIVAEEKIALTATAEGLQLGGQEHRCGDDPNRAAAR
jgi:hypothetical protein